jgi:hypothetical protein
MKHANWLDLGHMLNPELRVESLPLIRQQQVVISQRKITVLSPEEGIGYWGGQTN